MAWHHWCPCSVTTFKRTKWWQNKTMLCHSGREESSWLLCKHRGHKGSGVSLRKIQIPPLTVSFALCSPIRHVAYLARSSKPGKSWDDAVSALNTYRTPHHRHPLSGSAGCTPGGFSSPALLEGPGTTCPLQQKWCRNGLTRPPWSFCLLHNTCRGWDR